MTAVHGGWQHTVLNTIWDRSESPLVLPGTLATSGAQFPVASRVISYFFFKWSFSGKVGFVVLPSKSIK